MKLNMALYFLFGWLLAALLSLVAIAVNNEKGTPPDIAPPDGEPWLRTRPTTYPGRLSAV